MQFILHVLLDQYHGHVESVLLVTLFLYQREGSQGHLEEYSGPFKEEHGPNQVDCGCWHLGNIQLYEPCKGEQLCLHINLFKVYA